MFSFSRYTNDPETGARELASLLTDVKIFTGVHPGDLYGILIEHFGRREKYKQVKLKLTNLFYVLCLCFKTGGNVT